MNYDNTSFTSVSK